MDPAPRDPAGLGAVWICTDSEGHIQAVGRDARGRKQYRYHPRWRERRDETKYNRLEDFGVVLPEIRAAVARDLALTGLPRRKVLAAIVRLLDDTRLRIGNREYSRQNKSYGLKTLRDRHARIQGATVALQFRGKSGQPARVVVTDRRLAKVVRACQDLPGQELFQYLGDDGQPVPVHSSDVNAYLREVSGQDFTAKDFRTWQGTCLALAALAALAACEPCTTAGETRKAVVCAVREVAKCLGNTPAVCRKAYVHPRVVDAFVAHTLPHVQPGEATSEGAEALLLTLLASPEPALAQSLAQSLAPEASRT